MEQGEQFMLEIEVMETHTYPDLKAAMWTRAL
jgi:hypothetical protein